MQQLGAALLVLGSLLYVWYTFAAVDASLPIDVRANQLYAASAVLWLLGAGALGGGTMKGVVRASRRG